jgi:alkanesulfonate monooxygenase
MSVKFIGFIGTQYASETHAATGPVLDVNYVEASAKAHDKGGFDRALIAFHSSLPDSTLVAAHASSITST